MLMPNTLSQLGLLVEVVEHHLGGSPRLISM
jgi:hypothetical protein